MTTKAKPLPTPGNIKPMQWRIHTKNLLDEVLENTSTQILTRPLQIFAGLLGEVGERAAKLNDPVLNSLMMRMAIYTMAQPEHADYNEEIVSAVIEEGNQAKGKPPLLSVSCDAIETAAQRLSMRPDELAEALQDGGIAEMVEALRYYADGEVCCTKGPCAPLHGNCEWPECGKKQFPVWDRGRTAQAILAKLPAAGKAGG